MRSRTILLVLILVATAAVLFVSNKNELLQQDRSGASVEQMLQPQVGLPAAVEAKRQAMYAAALSGSYEQLAAEATTPFSYTFGEADTDLVTFLKNAATAEGKSALTIIPVLLEQPYGQQGDIYVWPGVFAKSAEEWTEADIAMMRQILTENQIEGYRQFGAYAYYRIGITAQGEWVYYLAGD